ncbi:MAG: peptidase M15 [Candidatus Puniceispirillum sp.]|nr:peptidase M15 [Candidatus Puniceispirillum sp.]
MGQRLLSCLFLLLAYVAHASSNAGEFVDITLVDPSLKVSLRYATSENFLGRVVPGYEDAKPVLTRQAADALKVAQALAIEQGYCLVIYDTYRPQRAVDAFMAWSKDPHDLLAQGHYYPHVDKSRVFELGYVAEKSGHSRGSTVDLTLIESGHNVKPVEVSQRVLLDGRRVPYLDDGTWDMGTSFDLFDAASHFENTVVEPRFHERRARLKDIMDAAGFKKDAAEWWHFTLRNEPFPDSYFDFLSGDVGK